MSTVEPLIVSAPEVTPEEVLIAPEYKAKKQRLSVGAWLSIIWLVLISGAAILAPILPIEDPNSINGQIVNKGPSADAWLGGTGNGQDVLARCIWGARISLLVGVGAILFGLLIGGTFGLIAGYYKGKLDTFLTGGFDILLAIPQLVLALTLVTVLAPQGVDVTPTSFERIRVLILTLGIVSVPVLARITRANTLAWAQREFVMAARAMGARNARVILREVLPNVMPAMFSIALLGVAVVIVVEGGLAIFGLSVPAPSMTWGTIIALGQGNLEKAPHVIFAPCAFIFLTVLSLNYLGDVVRARFDVRGSVL
jgi:peptide/nickel transport system permease protein